MNAVSLDRDQFDTYWGVHNQIMLSVQSYVHSCFHSL